MKSDLDYLMQANNLDAILIIGPAQHNPPMVYLTGGGHMTHADLIKKRGEPPILFCASMEREEAARTGLATRLLDDYRIEELLKQFDGDQVQAVSARYKQMFADVGFKHGRLAIYGNTDAGRAYSVFSDLQKNLPEIELVSETGDTVMLQAMQTKNEEEIERIRGIGKIATRIIGNTADFITSHAVKDEVVIQKDGAPLTIGQVKRRINLQVAEHGAENPEDTIFAMGHDAGVPHSTGTASQPLRMGQTIIFDFYPCEAWGGYYYDITRTWCLGYATDEALALYEDVYQVYHELRSQLRLNASCRDYQALTCELFEKRGHPTPRSHPQTTDGYVHSLGHGVGLYIHEMPFFRLNGPEQVRLAPGVVITLEPGLYYPDRNLGMRLEDTLWARPDGVFEVLADYPLDLVLPMKG
jgi:Xaa-Pro aminopeptidase